MRLRQRRLGLKATGSFAIFRVSLDILINPAIPQQVMMFKKGHHVP
jgi:hypothetical protein